MTTDASNARRIGSLVLALVVAGAALLAAVRMGDSDPTTPAADQTSDVGIIPVEQLGAVVGPAVARVLVDRAAVLTVATP